MIEVIFLICLALVWIIFASIEDIKHTEVADWLNYSLIIFALGFRFFYCLFNGFNFGFFYQGLIFFGIFFILGNLLYYSRGFGGGDAKLLIALGAILPFSLNFFTNLKFAFLFLFLFLLAGSIYGIGFSFYLGLKNFKEMKKCFFKILIEKKWLVFAGNIFGLLLIILGFFESILFFLGVLIFLVSYLFIYAKSIENCCMIKEKNVRDLLEGDLLVKNLKVGNKTIKINWEGLSREEIKLIQKSKLKKIVIKEGIVFVPVFLISFIFYCLIWFGVIGIFGLIL